MLLTTNLFCLQFLEAGIPLKRSQFFNKAVQKRCLFTLSHQALQGLATQKSFLLEKTAIYPHS